MSLTSVNPDNINQTANTSATDDKLMRQPPVNPVPAYDGIMPQQALNTAQQAATTAATGRLAQITQQGDQSIAAHSGSSGGSSGLGGIFGAVGSILGSLFAQGGFVGDKANGYASGGKVNSSSSGGSLDEQDNWFPPDDLAAKPIAKINRDPLPAPTGGASSAPNAVFSNDPNPDPVDNTPMQPSAQPPTPINFNPAPAQRLITPPLPINNPPTQNSSGPPTPPNLNPSGGPSPGPSPTPSPNNGPNPFPMGLADYTGLGADWTAPTFAKGGAVQNPIHHALAAGYLTGALHQAKFGGTPETLGQAAAIIKKMMGSGSDSDNDGDARMADGGMAPTPGNTPLNDIAQQSLMDALGLSGGKQTPQPPQMGNPAEVPTTIGGSSQPGMADGGPATTRSAMSNAMTITGEQMRDNRSPGTVSGMAAQLGKNIDTTQQLRKELELKGLKGFAIGGPGIGPQAQPNDPDNDGDFEGEVKGPGGPTDDAIPARLSNGEFVMSAASTAFFGVDKLNKMNEQGKQGFMQAKAQVDQNQNPQGQSQGMPQGGQGAPAMPQAAAMSSPMGMMQPPMQQAKGGPAIMKTKGSGYMGL